jgi:hypothetical protein
MVSLDLRAAEHTRETGIFAVLAQRARLQGLLEFAWLLHQRHRGTVSRNGVSSHLSVCIWTAKPDFPPAIAAWIMVRRSAAINRSRRAFIRANWPCCGLFLRISFLLGRHFGDQLFETSKTKIVVAPRPAPTVRRGHVGR